MQPIEKITNGLQNDYFCRGRYLFRRKKCEEVQNLALMLSSSNLMPGPH
jgi:hypothetical protein